MVAAYLNAESGQYCKELDVLAKVDRFGLKAIYGRDTFYYGELRRLIVAENVHYAYTMRKNSTEWDKLQAAQPELMNLLFEAEKLAHE